MYPLALVPVVEDPTWGRNKGSLGWTVVEIVFGRGGFFGMMNGADAAAGAGGVTPAILTGDVSTTGAGDTIWGGADIAESTELRDVAAIAH